MSSEIRGQFTYFKVIPMRRTAACAGMTQSLLSKCHCKLSPLFYMGFKTNQILNSKEVRS